MSSGAAPALTTLFLSRNQIGDEGLRHLGDALARGAAPALEELDLDYSDKSATPIPTRSAGYSYSNKIGNRASDAAKQALRDARPGLDI